jgi:hypothetical protein
VSLGASSGVALAGCGHDKPAWTRLAWRPAALPVAAGHRAVVGGATWCGDRWVVVGATADHQGDTRPAAWVSSDAERWRPLPLHPGRDYYAERAVLTSVGCSHDRLAALGAKPGGAHGNPRVETWRQLGDGSLAAVVAPFEQYGGQDAVSVNRMAGGDGGFLVEGTRVTGAAVWNSRTGERFTLHEDAPGLASTTTAGTQALDAVWWRRGWTVAGDSSLADGRLVATVWTGSGAGPWTATRLPAGQHLTTGERIAVTPEGPVVAGLDDTAFAIWTHEAGRWSLSSTFGARRAGSTVPAFVSGLAVVSGLLAATYSDGAAFRLAVGPPAGPMDDARLPVGIASRGDHTVTLAAHRDLLLLATDDGERGRVWLTRVAS